MTTRKQIILAVAEGCTNTRQVAERLNRPLSTINHYFYNKQRFANGQLLKWVVGKAHTFQLGPRAAVFRGPGGQITDVGMVADMDDLVASYLTRDGK